MCFSCLVYFPKPVPLSPATLFVIISIGIPKINKSKKNKFHPFLIYYTLHKYNLGVLNFLVWQKGELYMGIFFIISNISMNRVLMDSYSIPFFVSYNQLISQH